MQLVHSALRNAGHPPAATARRQGYLAACLKHRDTLAAIQQYLPGWLPFAPAESDSYNEQPRLTACS